MGWTYAWESDEVGMVKANYATRDDAERQAAHDAQVLGGPRPRHILDPDGIVAAAYADEQTFEVVALVDDRLQVVQTKDAPDVGDVGNFVVRQRPLDDDELAAYAAEYVQQLAE